MKNKISEEVISEIFPRKVRRSKLSEEVYDQLKKMILSGKFKKGQRLVEEKLSRRLNVSRNPVQIALLRLRKEKLVVWKYKKGTFVN
jgi:DNA-binding GntR family transcriptional regulator